MSNISNFHSESSPTTVARENAIAATNARLLREREKEKCLDKLGIKKTRQSIRESLVIDNLGHIYCSTGPPRFECKFAQWNNYGPSCPVRIFVYNVLENEDGWRKINLIRGFHNHKSPIRIAWKLASICDFHASINPTEENKNSQDFMEENLVMNGDKKLESENSQKMGETSLTQDFIEENLTMNGDKKSESENSQKIRKKSVTQKRMRLQSGISNGIHTEIGSENNGEKRKKGQISAATCNSVKNTFESSLPANDVTAQITSQILTISSGLSIFRPLAKLTKSTEEMPQPTNCSVVKMTSTADLLLPAWTNCTKCKACVLIESNSKTKDLHSTAIKHITEFHGPINFVTKEMITRYLPYILKLKKVKQMPVNGSLPVNEVGDYKCANCSDEMINAIDVTENDNDLVNHVIYQHLSPGEEISNAKFWECFPICAPQTKLQNSQEITFVKME